MTSGGTKPWTRRSQSSTVRGSPQLARVKDGGRSLSSASYGGVGVEFIAVSLVRVGDDALELEGPTSADEHQHLIGRQLLDLVSGQKRVTVLRDAGGRTA